MPISKINTFGIADNAVISSKIAQDIVVADDIASSAITVNELANNAVTTDKILDGTIISTDLANDAVTTVKILDGNVTTAKIANDAITVDKIGDNAVTLGTHTTGNYMSNVTAGSGISITHTQGEGSSAQIAIDSTSGFLVANDTVRLGTHTLGNYTQQVNTVSYTAGANNHPIAIGTSTQYNGDAQNYTLSLDMTDDFSFLSEVKAKSYVDVHQVAVPIPGQQNFLCNVGDANSFKITLGANSGIVFSAVPTSATETMIWTITIQQGSGPYTVTYPTNVHWPGGIKPTLSTANGAIDQFVFMKTGSSSNIYGFTVGQDIKAPASP